jgi:hypothetical protein
MGRLEDERVAMAAAIEAELRAAGLADAARQSASTQREAVSAARHVIEAFGTPAHAQRAPSAAAPAAHDCRQDWRATLSDAVHWTQQTAHVVAQDIDTVHSELAAKLQLMPHGIPAEFSAAPLGQLELAAEKAGFLWKEGAIASLTSMHKCWCLLLPAAAAADHGAGDGGAPTTATAAAAARQGPQGPQGLQGPHSSKLDLSCLDRWLVCYDRPTAAAAAAGASSPGGSRAQPRVRGALALPHGGFSARLCEGQHERHFAFRLEVSSGPCAGASFVLCGDTADSTYSWMESLRAGADALSRLPRRDELRTMQALARELPPGVGYAFSPAPSSSSSGGDGGEAGRRTSFEPATDAADALLLRRCWAGMGAEPSLFCLKSEAWKAFGFQRDDPVSDLRACGRLALQQLVFFLEHHPMTARALCATQVQDDDFTNAYPWATASVAVTRMLCMIFEIIQPCG